MQEEKQAVEANSQKDDETAQSLGARVYAAAAEIDTEKSETQKATREIRISDNKKNPEEKGWTSKSTSILSANGNGAKIEISVNLAKKNLGKIEN